MKEYKYILFDFFGTLAEYNKSLFDSPCSNTIKLIHNQGVKLNETEFMHLFNDCFDKLEQKVSKTNIEYSMDDVAVEFYKSIGVENVPMAYLSELSSTYMSEWIKGVSLYKGVNDLLNSLNYKKAIITNTHYASLVPDVVTQFKVEKHFDLIETSVENGHRKPSVKIFLDTVDKLGCNINDVLYVGDNPECDYFGPRKVNIDSILITNDQIEEIPMDHQISNILELKVYLEI